jgi:predicted nucleotide-binding protein (sugar kinase/HSP70/actin superfamily)
MTGSIADDLVDVASSLPWVELEAFATGKYATVSDKTYQFVINESNREFLLKAALKSLQKTDPENANEYRAEQLADMMKRFAQNALKHKTKQQL